LVYYGARKLNAPYKGPLTHYLSIRQGSLRLKSKGESRYDWDSSSCLVLCVNGPVT